jgi:hypothetical protein
MKIFLTAASILIIGLVLGCRNTPVIKHVYFTKKCNNCIGYECSGSIFIKHNKLSFWKRIDANTAIKPDTVIPNIHVKMKSLTKNSVFITNECTYKIIFNNDTNFKRYSFETYSDDPPFSHEITLLDSLLSYSYKLFTSETTATKIDQFERLVNPDYDHQVYKLELKAQGIDSATIEKMAKVHLEAERKKGRWSSNIIQYDATAYEWIINSKHIVGNGRTVILNPSSNKFDTIYYHNLADEPDNWDTILCKIPEKAKYYFAINHCCGGQIIHKVHSPKKPSVVLNITNAKKGKVYLARFGSAGTILKPNKPVILSDPCFENMSAMATPRPVTTIELIDTGKIVEDIQESLGEEYPREYKERIESLNCTGNEPIGEYLRFSIVRTIDYIWFDTRPLIIDFDAKTGNVDLKLKSFLHKNCVGTK